MTESMIERVARALMSAQESRDLDYASPMVREAYMFAARAAIEAMREPTDAMVDAMEEHAGTIAPQYAYEAAIGAALNEQVSGELRRLHRISLRMRRRRCRMCV